MRAFRFLLGALLCLIAIPVNAATTLLPPGMQCFTDANGPIISGSVNMFYPATTTAKPTWQDSNQVTLNSQPIQLDSNGCATIYGIGSYRQEVFDGPVVGGNTSGNLIFDKITTDTSAYNAVFWSGLAGGTPNVITIVDPGFNATDGTVINFTALANNTGSVTINPSSFGAINVVKDTAAGPVTLTGGEIIAGNVISVVYSASANDFHLLNTSIASASGNTAPLCGTTNLRITNDAGTPNSIIDITADVALMISPAGVVINNTNISTTINITSGTATSMAGGMDGEAPGTSAWLYIWLINNGSTTSGLATAAAGNGLAPNMPSGYTFKCRIGAMRIDAGGDLMRTLQRGPRVQYKIVTPSNTAVVPNIANGIAGTYSATNPVLAAVSITPVVPPTASEINIIAATDYKTAGASGVMVAPNVSWGGANNGPQGSNGQLWPFYDNASGATVVGHYFSMVIEGTTIAWASSAAGAAISCMGWTDQVNAN